MFNTYKVSVNCSNCRNESEIKIPIGTFVIGFKCTCKYCKCSSEIRKSLSMSGISLYYMN